MRVVQHTRRGRKNGNKLVAVRIHGVGDQVEAARKVLAKGKVVEAPVQVEVKRPAKHRSRSKYSPGDSQADKARRRLAGDGE